MLQVTEQQDYALKIVSKMKITGINGLKKKDLIALLTPTGIPQVGTKKDLMAAFIKFHAQASLAAQQKNLLENMDEAEQVHDEEVTLTGKQAQSCCCQ